MAGRSRALVLVAAVLCGFLLFILPLAVRFAEVSKAWKGAGREHQARMLRIDTLPELHAVILSDGVIRAPFSQEEVAVCAIIQGMADKHETWQTPRDHATYLFRRDMVIRHAPELIVDINGERYTRLPDSLTIAFATSWTRQRAEMDGSLGARYESFEHRWPFNEVDSAYWNAAVGLRGGSTTIDRFIAQGPRSPERDICLEELLYRIGDTLRFKGRIEEGRIVPLY